MQKATFPRPHSELVEPGTSDTQLSKLTALPPGPTPHQEKVCLQLSLPSSPPSFQGPKWDLLANTEFKYLYPIQCSNHHSLP